MPKLLEDFKKQLPEKQLKINEPLAPYTTLKIGGPADLFFVAQTEDELIKAVKLAQKYKIDWVVLGWGSNILISDDGFRGLVIRNQSKEIKILGPAPENIKKERVISEEDRHDFAVIKGKEYEVKFDDLDYDETHLPVKLVKAASGEGLQKLITWTLEHGLTGLQWFARIPGTIGGAVFNNIHGGSHFFEEYLHEVTVLNPQGEIKTLTINDLGFGYDRSRFHQSGETILNVTLKLFEGDVDRAKEVAMQWANRKSVQPHNSPGCVFKNITQQERKRLGYPTTGTGYIIEWILKFTNKKVGGARVYDRHHNFIVNDGNATAKDYLTLIKQIKAETKRKTGVNLEPEIIFVGFSDEELKGVSH